MIYSSDLCKKPAQFALLGKRLFLLVQQVFSLCFNLEFFCLWSASSFDILIYAGNNFVTCKCFPLYTEGAS